MQTLKRRLIVAMFLRCLIAGANICTPSIASATDLAACPVALKSIVSAGAAASGAFTSYQVRVWGPKKTISSVTLALRLLNGKQVETTWNAVEPKASGDPKYENGSAYGTFDRRTPDVTAAAVERVVTTPASSPFVCTPSWVDLGGPEDQPNLIVVFNDATHRFDPDVENVSVHDMVDAHFIYRAQPQYPVQEGNARIQGDVTLRFTVDTTGKAINPTIVKSSQNDDFDNEALQAIQRSSFEPATVGGIHEDREYLVVYTFRVPPPAVPVPQPDCPVTVAAARLANVGQPSASDWMLVSVETSREDVSAARIAFETSDEHVEHLVQWQDASFERMDPSGKNPATAVFTWSGAQPHKVWISDLTLSDGTVTPCAPYYEIVNESVDRAPGLRTGNIPTSPFAYTLRVVAPIRAAKPVYPAAELLARTSGRVSVAVAIAPDGKPLGALVVTASKNASLNASAFQAAMSSVYPASTKSSEGVRFLEVDYSFADSPS
jgi:TonB family protein